MFFSLVIGQVEITPAYYPEFVTSLHYTFALFTILSCIGIAASLMRRKAEPSGPHMI
jgi:hypothetical protein